MSNKKKTVKDMPSDWHKEHRCTGLPNGPDGWCRDLGIANPDAPTAAELAEAWKEVRELILVGEMVKDISDAIYTILRSPDTSEIEIQLLNRIKPMIDKAMGEMRKAGEIADANDLPQGGTMPEDEEKS